MHFDLDDATVLAAMGGVHHRMFSRRVTEQRLERGPLALHAQVLERQCTKFLARVSVLAQRGVIDVEKPQRAVLKHPRRQRAALKQRPRL